MRNFSAFSTIAIGLVLLLATPAAAVKVTNVTTDTLIFFENFETSPNGVSTGNYPDTSGDYDPDNGAYPGDWSITEPDLTGPVTNWQDVQVTNSTTTPDPGPFEGNNYGRFARTESTPTSDAVFGTPVTTGQTVRVDLMYTLSDGFTSSSAGFLLIGDSNESSDQRLTTNTFTPGGNVRNHDSTGHTGSGLSYDTSQWNHLVLEYTVGETGDALIDDVLVEDANIFTLTINGVSTTLAMREQGTTITSVTALRMQGHSFGFTQLMVDAVPDVPELVINRSDGSMRLQNNNVNSINGMLGYQIRSIEAEALDQSGWTPITGNYDDSGNGLIDSDNNWTILSDAGDYTDLAEAELLAGDGGNLLTDADFDLGSSAWIKNANEDVTLQFLTSDGKVYDGVVTFVGGPNNAPYDRSDLNFDGQVDENDWPIYVAGLLGDFSDISLAQGYQQGDLNYDGVNDADDLDLFIKDFENAMGAGSFQAMLASIPEPSSAALCLLAVAGLFWRRGSRLSS